MPYTQVVITDPLYLQPDTYTAQDDRRMFADLLSAGIVGTNDFLVTFVSVLTVQVAAGVAYIPGLMTADQGHYRLREPSSRNISVGVGDGTNPRIDQIILRVLDHIHDTSGLDEARIEVIPGTPTSGATLANRSGAADLTTLTESSKNVLLLADVLVPAGATSIDASKIGDKRVRAKFGGNLPGVAAPFVTTLPTSPIDGDECIYEASAASRIYWRLKYKSSISKWVKIGGPPLLATVATAETTASTSYTDLATVGPSITVPLSGDYYLSGSSQAGNSSASNVNGLAYKIAAAAAVEIAANGETGVGTDYLNGRITRTVRVTCVAGDVVKLQYKAFSGTAQFQGRDLLLDPIFVS